MRKLIVVLICLSAFGALAAFVGHKARDPLTTRRIDEIVARDFNASGDAHRMTSENDLAILDYDKAIELDAKYAKAYRGRGDAHAAKREYNSAIADYGRAIELKPDDAVALNGLGDAQVAKGEYASAITNYSKAVEIRGEFARAYDSRADAYRKSGENNRAISDYSRVIALRPNYAPAYISRAFAHLAEGEYSPAIADATKASEIDPKSAWFLQVLGNIRFATGDYRGASSDLLRSIEIDADAYAILLRYLARSRAGEEAKTELRANVGRLKTKAWPYAVVELYLGPGTPVATLDAAADPVHRCAAQVLIGEWHILKDDKAEAEAAFRAALEACPKDLRWYAVALAELKRPKP